jgi:hypothetical protein
MHSHVSFEIRSILGGRLYLPPGSNLIAMIDCNGGNCGGGL